MTKKPFQPTGFKVLDSTIGSTKQANLLIYCSPHSRIYCEETPRLPPPSLAAGRFRRPVSGADCKASSIEVPWLPNVRGPAQRVETGGAGERDPSNLMRIMPPQGSVSSPPPVSAPSVQVARTSGI